MQKYIKVAIGYNLILIPVTARSIELIGELLNAIPVDKEYKDKQDVYTKENRSLEIELIQTEIKDKEVIPEVIPAVVRPATVRTDKYIENLDEAVPF